jgi:hypothetical protein
MIMRRKSRKREGKDYRYEVGDQAYSNNETDKSLQLIKHNPSLKRNALASM